MSHCMYLLLLWLLGLTCELLTQNNAEMAVREMLKEIAQERRQETGVASLAAHDYMDDGTRISLNISLDESQVISLS